MLEKTIPKPLLIFDSSPLITLALFPVHKPAIETILAVADVIIVETVASETTAYSSHRDATMIASLLAAKRILRYPVPTTSQDRFIDGYHKVDSGERDTIRLALTMPQAQLVIDDAAAFITAAHCDLSPIMLLDLLVSWSKIGILDKETAAKIVTVIASRYSEAYVNHSKFRINEA